MNFDLSGKIAVVTAGNGAIGFGTARGLVEAGATVTMTGRNVEKTPAHYPNSAQTLLQPVSM